MATLTEIGANASSLSIPLYVKRRTATTATATDGQPPSLQAVWEEWQTEGRTYWLQMDALLETLDGVLMEDVVSVTDKKTQLKPGWRNVKFGDVVRLSKARTQNPIVDGYDRYVGLEHLESRDLRIRGWGNVADGVTFTSIFQPGQILFGKRRAYQRKVAVADFAGVCSGDDLCVGEQRPDGIASGPASVSLPDRGVLRTRNRLVCRLAEPAN